MFFDHLLHWTFCSRLACIVLPSGESVCNNRKNNTTDNLHALVHDVCHFERTTHYIVLETTIANAQITIFQWYVSKDFEHM